jgi:hypothetical protein
MWAVGCSGLALAFLTQETRLAGVFLGKALLPKGGVGHAHLAGFMLVGTAIMDAPSWCGTRRRTMMVVVP